MARIVARIKFKRWAFLLKPIWICQIALGYKKVWIPECSIVVSTK